MLQIGKRWTVASAVVALVFALGATSASGAGLSIHSVKPSGLVRPLGAGGAVQHTGAVPLSGVGPGSPSQYCNPNPPPLCSPPLLYGGGPVMHAVTTHVIAWGSGFPPGYVSGYEHYLSDLAHDLNAASNSPEDSSVAQQYVDAAGPALSALSNDSVINDSDAYPSSDCTIAVGATACLTESQILTEVGNVIAQDALSVDVNQSYVVLLPPGIDSCFDSSSMDCEDQAFCGYHDSFTIGSGEATFTLLPYTESAYGNPAPGQCNDPSAPDPSGQATDLQALISVGTHELMESATDPLPGSGYTDINGWEIGDECAYIYGTVTADGGGGTYNQFVNGDEYGVQMMWSNQDNNCVQGTAVPAAAATITPGANPRTTSPISFSAALTHDANAASSYEWSYEDPDGNIHTNVSSSATPSLALSTGGPNTVWVEITDAAGGTVTGVTSVDVIGTPPTASFGYTVPTRVPAVQSPVSFTSTSTPDSTEQITSSSWNFGDGTSGSGASVSHSYAAAGRYTVTLTVQETDGQTAHTSQAITVDAPPVSAFGSSPSSPDAEESVNFSSSGTAAGTGAITSYSWAFGDGGSSSASNPSHIYTATGNYTVALTVTQTDGLTATIQHSVLVGAFAAAVSAELRQALAPPSGETKITTLLRKGGATSALSPSVSGHVRITWYAKVKHHSIVVARGSATGHAGVAAHVVVKLTAAGRALLRKSKSLKLTITGVYTSGSSSVTVSRTVTLKR